MLTDTAIVKAAPGAKPKRLTDSRGLYLLVMPNGARYWRYDYLFAEKRRTMSLGVYPDISLKDARGDHEEARRLLRAGQDPLLVKSTRRLTSAVASQTSFEAVTEEWVTKQARTAAPATTQKRRIILGNWLLPVLGKMPIAAIEPPMLLAALQAIERKQRHETAHRSSGMRLPPAAPRETHPRTFEGRSRRIGTSTIRRSSSRPPSGV